MGSNDPPSPKRGHLTFTLESLESIHICIRVCIARSVENQSGNALIIINNAHMTKSRNK